ncbi:MAG: Ribonucleoside-diphosphate reductase [candidate division WWE3 bacterium GW2011_GWA1_46_21]|uniref:Vitamin B12-dependent ribonucleotide reductase n=3 Tax=Katanobacteria TaxID=422282 RepID=A0A0G1PG50_UNCKA|nr:MAG: Ribonucleoside-diphosphate reductase [candidate division WWE3 bacterium GW2011_GWA1_46_21]KKU49240.1 MAG: Ribonucleoside-diphosphate reductase [candidate division WWE3 bacterium GW2011_GWA2_46_9]KKU57760.1 MAG: Ribonucleoside-diphosphate reductase [candidate division WWE3 bacterium GW2011_GWB1_47_11]
MNWLKSQPTDKFPPSIKTKVTGSKKNPTIDLTDNARTVLERRYLRKNEKGVIAETVEEMFDRVAKTVAAPDEPYRDVAQTEIEFYNMLTTKKFFPNSPTFTGAGTPLGQLAACFVLPIEDDLGRNEDGIFSVLRAAALIQQVGGGNGFSFSDLRQSGAIVKSSGGKATGPVGFLRVYDAAFGEVAQGGARRGANMAVLRVDHPDVREFIRCKSSEGTISNFNISVAVTDEFMEAVKKDTTYNLIAPQSGEVIESPRAREIFEMIVKYAHQNGEPGVLFIDAANRQNPVPHLYALKATNPCGEQFLGPYENCCLGSINLAQHLNEFGSLDWEELKLTIKLATHFLDNVVTANKYVPSVPQLRIAAENARRIGLGFMGLADVMYSMGIRYGSDEAAEFAAQITEFIRFHAMSTSVALAKERGAFLAIKGSVYDPENIKWQAPAPLSTFSHNFGRPSVVWDDVLTGIAHYGIRNAAQTTVAPTGVISTVAGVEGYGCEPAFALAYTRNVYQTAGDAEKLTLDYMSPLFSMALDSLNFDPETRKRVVDKILKTGSCQDIDEIPQHIKNVFVVSSDITPAEHIQMQAAIQVFVDNSISKTCNFPATATQEDVAAAYMLGWASGCKGLTVYVTGTRKEVVLSTKETKDKLNSPISPLAKAIPADRGYKLSGTTYKMNTPQGKAFVTVNRDEAGNPFEVFVQVGKAGSDSLALSEALGRSLSGWLRTSSDPTRTVKEIVVQLLGIGGARTVGFGKNRVSSVPDAVAQVLADEFGIKIRANGSNVVEDKRPEVSVASYTNICPECGNSSFIQEEGCSKCFSCGFSLC